MFFNLHHAFTTYVCTMQCIQLKLDFYIKFHIEKLDFIYYSKLYECDRKKYDPHSNFIYF